MTTSLFSQLLSEIKTDISPNSLQQELMKQAPSERTIVGLVGAAAFWKGVASSVTNSGEMLNTKALLDLLARQPDMSIDDDDFFI